MPLKKLCLKDIHLLFKYFVFLLGLSVFVGAPIALYTYSIQWVTAFRFTHPLLIYALPLFGIVAIAAERSLKKNAVSMDLVLDALHHSHKIPLIGGIYVYAATVLTHLFGASVGAEGTAVQFSASVASFLNRSSFLKKLDSKLLIAMGSAAGFGAVFNVPLAGAFFACEFTEVKRFNYHALFPCLLASFGAVEVRSWTGVFHPQYSVLSYATRIDDFHVTEENWKFWLGSLLAAVVFGLLARIYTEGLHCGTGALKKLLKSPYVRIVLGGVVTIVLASLIGTREYLGLGTLAQHPHDATIMNFFTNTFYPTSWGWKLLFAWIALCSGYKGGEVTVLFFIGAAGGNALAHYLHIPTDLLASAGMISVFAAASNTPITGFVLAMELFGCVNGTFYFVVCYLAFLVSNPSSSIYLGQRILQDLKEGEKELISLKQFREKL